MQYRMMYVTPKLTWRSTGHIRCPSHKTESFLACPGSQTARLFQSVGWMKPDLLILAFTNYKNGLCVIMNSVETLDNINMRRSEGCRILQLFQPSSCLKKYIHVYIRLFMKAYSCQVFFKSIYSHSILGKPFPMTMTRMASAMLMKVFRR